MGKDMAAKSTAKIFMHGRSQAVRLPKEFRLPGKEVRVRKVGDGVLLEPIEKKFDFDKWLARVHALAGKDFLPEGRPEQPQWTLDDDVSFD
jgi:antitoxin VapB